MCRAGGRRCEHNWSEAQHQADLARRRAIYASKHSHTGVESTFTSSPLSMPSGSLSSCVEGKTEHEQQCNLKYVDYDKQEQEFQAYKTTEVRGKIIPEGLNDSSYSEFGFQNPNRWENSMDLEEASSTDWEESAVVSKNELRALTLHEQAALATFTVNSSYRNINRYLHDSPRAEPLNYEPVNTEWHHTKNNNLEDNLQMYLNDVGDDETEEDAQYTSVQHYAQNLRLNSNIMTASKLRSYVDTVDSAFSKADGRQRIVYRGEHFKSDSMRFEGYKTLADYADENFKVGNQVSFKGMQSTSMTESTAIGFADDSQSGGIIYEISTPSGVNVSAVSIYGEESEVLLPRNSTYRVVGKTYTYRSNSKIAVIQLVEVDENDNIRHAGNLRKQDEFGKFDVDKFPSNPPE